MRVADSAPADAERFMRIALQSAERGMAAGGPPVGACLVRDGAVLVAGHNSVIADVDITAHAEIVVIREACRQERSLSLKETSLFVTVEPCPMCLSACHYAGVGEICFAASIDSFNAVTGNELCVSADQLFPADGAPSVSGGVLAAEAERLIDQWRALRQGRPA